MKIRIAMFPPIPIPLSRGRFGSDHAERLAGDHKQDAGQSGGRNDDKREPNGRAMQRAAQQRQQDRGNSENQKQAGQQLRGAVPLNISRMVAMAPHGGTRDTLEGAWPLAP
jgi:hypothetical protein